jgi:hypothetical protein
MIEIGEDRRGRAGTWCDKKTDRASVPVGDEGEAT